MKGSLVAAEVYEPYAQALMSLAQDNDLVDQFGHEVNQLLELLSESQEFKQFLSNPLIKPEAKKAVIQQVVGDQANPYILNFLMLLVDRRRIGFLEGICKQYQTLLRQLKRILLAEVTSATALTDEQRESVRQKIVDMSGGQQVELDVHVDPDLIGGVIIKVGSQVFDASIRGQLRRISLALTGN
ncbi:MAG: F0F1 ATP synthase subunit delta [Synechococcales cyanobacterium T60_A2020_003]|nr:F0F1 ATP synthase subunit delta [Synechococcales cyanobacterium T60_A2020_003]